MEAADILKILAAIAVVFAAGFTLKIAIGQRKSSKNDVRFVSQKNNVAGGDIVAGDSTKKTHK